MKTYTIAHFRKEYPNDDVCLDKIFQLRYGNLQGCPHCGVVGVKFRRITTRKAYQCPECYFQIHPTADTIFEKSTTPLTYWFYAIHLFTVTRNGVAAKELERSLGVTYKTAWRMANRIRRLMNQGQHKHKKLTGIVEVDETFIRGKAQEGTKKYRHGKTPVMAIVQRGGDVRAYQIPNTTNESLLPCIVRNVSPEARIMTDEWRSYMNLEKMGFDHSTIRHRLKQYAKGDVYTNTVEGYFSIVKRTINGTYVHVSNKYLQSYVNEVTFRYNNRNRQSEMFDLILARA